MPLPNPKPSRKPSGSLQALAKAEKLTQIAFALPLAALVGWGLGVLADRVLHQQWIWIAGLILGVIAGFVQVFRMVREPGLLSAAAPDPNAPKGPGFNDRDESESR